jgi:hypothetical protein
MFVNDLTGLCRNNVFGVDFNSQIPTGLNTWNTIPYNWGLGYNVMGQYFHPSYGVVYNRLPQTVGQTFGQTFGQNIPTFGQNIPTFGQGFVQNVPSFGQVNTPFVPYFGQHVPFTNPFLGHNPMITNTLGLGYGITPYGVNNWNSPLNFQSGICR